jgi:hypothetical protein
MTQAQTFLQQQVVQLVHGMIWIIDIYIELDKPTNNFAHCTRVKQLCSYRSWVAQEILSNNNLTSTVYRSWDMKLKEKHNCNKNWIGYFLGNYKAPGWIWG